MTLRSLPLYCFVTLRPKMVVIFLGCPIFRFRSSKRWVSSSTAGPAIKDEVIAVLDLCKEQTVLAASLPPLLIGEEWSERCQPFLPALE